MADNIPAPDGLSTSAKEAFELERFGYTHYLSCTESIDFGNDYPEELSAWWALHTEGDVMGAWEAWLYMPTAKRADFEGDWVQAFQEVDAPARQDFLASQDGDKTISQK
ncbi:hypothetical protein GF380_01505 [Candidatus Uhrbacteria bacterium]|nr:hypothetical protein [Candidatus Uhrbacteria bacterium]